MRSTHPVGGQDQRHNLPALKHIAHAKPVHQAAGANPTRRAHWLCASLLLCTCGVPLACTADRSETVDLRRDVVELQGEVKALQFELQRREETLRQRDRQVEALQKTPPEVLSLLPKPTELQLDAQATTWVYKAADRRTNPHRLQVVFRPRDTFGSVVRNPSRVSVRVVDLLSPQPVELGSLELDEPTLARQFFDTRLLRQYYMVEVPLTRLPSAGEVVIRLSFIDSIHGLSFMQTAAVAVNRPADAPRDPPPVPADTPSSAVDPTTPANSSTPVEGAFHNCR